MRFSKNIGAYLEKPKKNPIHKALQITIQWMIP